MFRAGAALTIVGVAIVAIGVLAIPSVTVPLPGRLHSTFFLPGSGGLVAVIGVGVMVWSRLRSGA
jgi:hypothetical protein